MSYQRLHYRPSEDRLVKNRGKRRIIAQQYRQERRAARQELRAYCRDVG